MIRKGIAALVILAALLAFSVRASSQTRKPDGGADPAAQDSSAAATAASSGAAARPASSPASSPAVDTNTVIPPCPDGNCEPSTPRITIATAADAFRSWPWQQRVAWGANIVLAILGYVGIMIALSTLRKIERQTRYGEEAAQAAAESAKVAMLQAQAMVRAERPWIVVTSESSAQKENTFLVVATNRGRSPARILRSLDAITTAADEASLPANPALGRGKEVNPVEGMILLPGESTTIRIFDRDEFARLFAADKQWKDLEGGAINVYLYGKVAYRDLAEPDHVDAHGTGWCFQYLHGRQKSILIKAGPQAYSRHT